MEDRNIVGRQAVTDPVTALRVLANQYFRLLVEKSRTLGTSEFILKIDNIKLVPKERPRTGANGHHYTPKRTQDFEKAIANAAREAMQAQKWTMVTYPLTLTLTLTTPKQKKVLRDPILDALAFNNYLVPAIWDVDNVTKAVTDAMNRVVFADDKQIRKIVVSHTYDDTLAPDFLGSLHLRLVRSGLSLTEVDGFRKYVNSKLGK